MLTWPSSVVVPEASSRPSVADRTDTGGGGEGWSREGKVRRNGGEIRARSNEETSRLQHVEQRTALRRTACTHGKATPLIALLAQPQYKQSTATQVEQEAQQLEHHSSGTTLQEARTSHVRHPVAVAVDDRAHGRRDGLGEGLLSGVDSGSCCRPCCRLCGRAAAAALRPLRLTAAPTSARAPVRWLALALGLGLGALRLAGRSGLGRVHACRMLCTCTSLLHRYEIRCILMELDKSSVR